MRYIWDGSLETGVELIDTQHKQLFDAMNTLIDTFSAGKGTIEIKKSIDFLNDYTITRLNIFSKKNGYSKNTGTRTTPPTNSTMKRLSLLCGI